MDINRTLETAPAKIAELATKAEEARFCWKNAEIQLSQVGAKTHLLIKGENPASTQSDIKAGVTESTYDKQCEVLTYESEYKKCNIEVEKWINAFNSARKLANLRIEEMRSLNDNVKGGTK